MMKHKSLLFLIVLFACSSDKPDLKKIETEFVNKAKQFHELYITAGDCSERNAMVDKNIVFFENGQEFTYQNILEYCSYIKPKRAFDIYSAQSLVQPNVGYDFVEQYYVNPDQDTLRETTSRIWQLKSNVWLVTHMHVSRQYK